MPISGSKILMVDGESSLPVLKALASETRMLILGLLSHNVLNVSELAAALGLPHSTVNFNLKQLEQAGLLHVEYEPGTRGSQKLCSKRFDEIQIKMPGVAIESTDTERTEISMPIGNYRHLDAKPTCGLASETKIIGMLDDPRSFFELEHLFAQMLWFRQGYVEYAFPNNLPYGATAVALELSMEICSEAPQYDPDWPSDITIWINQRELGTWTSPGDLGGSRARLTPLWWQIDQSTHGFLKRWRVTDAGTVIDGEDLSTVTIDALALGANNHIAVRIGVKADARHVGGINLFGRKFGNYPQDIVMRLEYAFAQDTKPVQLR
jgi:predicted transcriptional regulator